MSAKGRFSVELLPQEDAEHPAGRLLIAKTYTGDMVGSAYGQMISKRTEGGAAIYYAIEEFGGEVHGVPGGFTLIHNGFMDSQTQQLEITILDGSGSGALANISGSMVIEKNDEGHSYELTYTL